MKFLELQQCMLFPNGVTLRDKRSGIEIRPKTIEDWLKVGNREVYLIKPTNGMIEVTLEEEKIRPRTVYIARTEYVKDAEESDVVITLNEQMTIEKALETAYRMKPDRIITIP